MGLRRPAEPDGRPSAFRDELARHLHVPDSMKLLRKARAMVLRCGIALSLMVSGLSGLVLCVGSDGRLTIETERHDCCADEGEPSAHPENTERRVCSDDDCIGCVDVSLSLDNLSHPDPTHGQRRRTAPERLSSVPYASMRDGTAIHRLTGVPPRLPVGAPWRLSPALLVRRTAFLLI